MQFVFKQIIHVFSWHLDSGKTKVITFHSNHWAYSRDHSFYTYYTLPFVWCVRVMCFWKKRNRGSYDGTIQSLTSYSLVATIVVTVNCKEKKVNRYFTLNKDPRWNLVSCLHFIHSSKLQLTFIRSVSLLFVWLWIVSCIVITKNDSQTVNAHRRQNNETKHQKYKQKTRQIYTHGTWKWIEHT